jgi:hypothetical protein
VDDAQMMQGPTGARLVTDTAKGCEALFQMALRVVGLACGKLDVAKVDQRGTLRLTVTGVAGRA